MKPLKAALVLLGVLVLSWLAARELRHDKSTGQLKPRELLFPYSSSRVTKLTLRNSDRVASWMRDASGEFQLVDGPAEADKRIAPDVIGAWSRIQFLEVVEEQPTSESLQRFGLQKPLVEVSAELGPDPTGRDGRRHAALRLGDASPSNPQVYAQVDDFPRVVLVGIEANDLVLGVGRKAVGLEPVVAEDDHAR